jgi:hypothetical protein
MECTANMGIIFESAKRKAEFFAPLPVKNMS